MTETATQAQASLTRTVDGAELPVPGTYAIDSSHSAVEFAVRHLGLAKVRGGFSAFDGVIEIADRPEESNVTIDVDVASIDTGEPNRDEHLRTNVFFDVANHPTMSFRSTRVTGSGTNWTVEGDLTLRGVTNQVTLDVTFEGAGGDQWGGQRIALFRLRRARPGAVGHALEPGPRDGRLRHRQEGQARSRGGSRQAGLGAAR